MRGAKVTIRQNPGANATHKKRHEKGNKNEEKRGKNNFSKTNFSGPTFGPACMWFSDSIGLRTDWNRRRARPEWYDRASRRRVARRCTWRTLLDSRWSPRVL